MANIHTLINSKIGTFTVKSRTKNERGNRARFVCECECGNIVVIFADELITEKYSSCKCTLTIEAKDIVDVEENAIISDIIEVAENTNNEAIEEVETVELLEMVETEKVTDVEETKVVESVVE